MEMMAAELAEEVLQEMVLTVAAAAVVPEVLVKIVMLMETVIQVMVV